jgi:hypothetical protein
VVGDLDLRQTDGFEFVAEPFDLDLVAGLPRGDYSLLRAATMA